MTHVTPGLPDNLQERLITCRAVVSAARQTGDQRQLCLDLIDLGVALFRTKEYEQAVNAFTEAEQLAESLADPHFTAHCLGLQAAAYQDIGRFHNAYEVIDRVVALAEAHHDQGMTCDALITQAQILANSGEPLIALDKLNQARALANQMDDKRHLMNTLGALGNTHTTLTALNEAQTCFEMAAALAAQMNDQRAECGYLLNAGIVLVWQKALPQAVSAFERALALSRTMDDREAELAALRHLTESLHNMGKPGDAIPFALHAIMRSQNTADPAITFSFFKTLILAYYRTNQPDAALDAIREAVGYAQAIDAPEYEVDMLLQLGEACMVLARYEQALHAYQQALEKIHPLDKASDEAYLVGRVGVALAELGQVQDAIPYHQRAVDLAHQHTIPDLEGEQLTMLALAYADQHEADRAAKCCQDAIAVFSDAGLESEADKARHLLAQLTVS